VRLTLRNLLTALWLLAAGVAAQSADPPSSVPLDSAPAGAALGGVSTSAKVPPPLPDCGSVVLVKCDKPNVAGVQAVTPAEAMRRESARRMEARRTGQLTYEMERIIIEGEGERLSPEAVISRSLSQPLVRQGENTYEIGESAQCTCMNICPPFPFPCCSCTDRVGGRHATSPGWKPTY